jgi:PKD repeat protein
MHKHGRAFLIFVGWLLVWVSASGQCPQPGFTIPDTVCLDQAFPIVNTSTGADRYEWDFCSGDDLTGVPTVTEVATVAGASIPTNLTTVFDGTSYFAFFFGRENNLLYRLNFGSSPGNSPTVSNVGNLGPAVNKPEPLDFVQEGDNWYAFTINTFGNSNLVRLNFGASLTNTPSITDLGNFSGQLNKSRGLRIANDNGNYVAVITNSGDNTLVLADLGTTITAPAGEIRLIKTVPISTVTLDLATTEVIQDCGRWYGLTLAVNTSSVWKLDFGAALFNLPAVSRLNLSIPTSALLFNQQFTLDAGKFAAVLLTLRGGMYHLNFGESMATPVPGVTDLGRLSPLADIQGFSMKKAGSTWFACAMGYLSNKIFRLTFPDPCGAPIPVSRLSSPTDTKYTRTGTHKVTLTAHNGTDSKSITKDIFVKGATSINFTATGSPPVFTAITEPGDQYVTWKWDFGDGTAATEASPTHVFPSDGTYNITLTATNTCGFAVAVTRKVSVVNNAPLSCPLPGFSLPDTVCTNEPFNITNTTIGAESYKWDFCSGDFTDRPTLGLQASIPTANMLTDVATVFDGSNWYGFASSRENNTLIRLEFGNSLDNTPTLVSMGTLNNLLSRPEQLKFMKEGDNWYALVTNLGTFATNFSIVRLNFGNDLKAIPQAERLVTLNPFLKMPRGLALAREGANTIAVITNFLDNSLLLVRFRGSIAAVPAREDILVTEALPNSTSGLIGVSLQKACNQWYGVASSYDKKFYKLSFGDKLFSWPAVEDLTHLYNFRSGPGRTVMTKDNDEYLAFVILFNGDLIRYNFGRDLATGEPSVAPAAHFVGEGTGLELVQSQSESLLLAPDYFYKKLYRFSFPSPCAPSVAASTQPNPAPLSYSQSGWHKINLTASDWDNNVSSRTDSVFVRPALRADFTADNQCLGAATRFVAGPLSSGNRITACSWNFGDGTTGTGTTAAHPYKVAGTYAVTLTATDLCGRTTSVTRSIAIYQRTTPRFVVPEEFCSNQPQTFADASVVINDTPVSWEWDFGNGSKATGNTVTYAYPDGGNYTVTLTVKGISGCSVSMSKAVTLRPGVHVNFSESSLCIGGQTQFLDQSVIPEGAQITSRQWDFGDNTFSTDLNPVHEYTTSGTYKVTLTISNAVGCTTFRIRDIVIRRLPRVNFGNSLACSGEQVSFAEESDAVEGAVTGWQWNFGDPGSGDDNISTQQHATHVYKQSGTYTVKLVIFTSYGCADSLAQTITVTPSPRADFTNQLSCGTRTVSFTSQSVAQAGDDLVGWYWEFGDGEVATTSNPAHTYRQAGTYPVTLVVTSGTRCRNVMQKTIRVFEAPRADFTLPAAVCAGQPVTLEDKSAPSPGDDIVQWQWQIAGQTFTERSPAITFPAGTNTAQVTLSVTTASGCQSTITRQIAVAEELNASFTNQSSTGQPLEVAFKAVASGAVAWQWSFGDGQSADSPDPVHSYSARGTYEVTLTVRNATGCTRTVTRNVTVVKGMEAYELRLERVALQGTGSSTKLLVRLLNKGSETLQLLSFVVAVDGGVPSEHTWKGSLPAGSALSYAFAPPGISQGAAGETFCVQAKDPQHGTVSNRECVNASNAFALLNPAPNPTRDQFRLAFILPEAGSVRLNIVDALGRTVVAEGRESPGGYSEKTQFLGHLARGMYFVLLTYRDQTLVKPLLID